MTKARTLADNYAADINQVSAGVGITGGGTSGTVTITNDMATSINAKGDLVVGTANDTYSRLAVASTAGYVLTVDSAEATGLKWGAPPGGGKVLQVVTATTQNSVVSNSTSFADTDLTCTITPSSTSSKILVLITQRIRIANATSTGDIGGNLRLVRNGTTLFTNTAPTQYTAGLSSVEARNIHAISHLDSPATTSAVTYKTQIATNYTSGYYTAEGYQNIVLLEIGA